MSYRDRADQRIADEVGGDKRLMCSAHNCPNLWSTSDGNLCRWHADAAPHLWPQVTQEMQDAVTNRIVDRQRPVAVPFVSYAEKKAILSRLRTVLTEPKDQRAWIERLRAKEASGERLSAMQKHCLARVRTALPESA